MMNLGATSPTSRRAAAPLRTALIAASVASALLLGGCVNFPAVTAGETGCDEREITVTNEDRRGVNDWTWNAECRGHRYSCYYKAGGKHQARDSGCADITNGDVSPIRQQQR